VNDTIRFDLVDQPWIPCVRVEDGGMEETGLRQVLTEPKRYREISDSSPLITVSLYRLLLAILHRGLNGPRNIDEWGDIWNNGWDVGLIHQHLDVHRRRFDLFDPDRPFYQTSQIEFEYETAVADIVHGMTLGNYSTLFDHTTLANPASLSPAAAARVLVGYQSFAPGGLVTYRSKHDEPRPRFGAADSALLAKAAVVLATGDTLFQTLMLNLVQYSREAGRPFPFSEDDDKPAWERECPATGQDRPPTGYVDLLTWQSRRIRYRPEYGDDGNPVVRAVVRMKGDQLPNRDHWPDEETMVPFRKNPRATGNQPPWNELALRSDRALWRDSTVLFQSIDDRQRRPRTLAWIGQLTDNRVLPRESVFSMDLFGMSIDRASIFFWRHERLPLPLEYLRNRELFQYLERGLALAEDVGRLFSSGWVPAPEHWKGKNAPSPMRILGASLVSPADPDRAETESIRQQVDSLAPGRIYWSRLEVPFIEFMQRMAEIWDPDDSWASATLATEATWVDALERIARDTFTETAGSLDLSGRELKATALAERQLNVLLSNLLAPYRAQREEVRG
jgi:CRISPR system Cascade subunit CasA